MTLYRDALKLLEMGISVIPGQFPSTKENRTKWIDKGAMYRRGHHFDYYKHHLPTEDDVKYWFKGPGRNRHVIVLCQDVICLDIEKKGLFYGFQDEYPEFRNTWRTHSPSGGHLWYRVRGHVTEKIRITWHPDDVEIKHNGAHIVALGKRYRTLSDNFEMMELQSVLDLPIVEMVPIPEVEAIVDTVGVSFFTQRKGKCQDLPHGSPIQRIKHCLPISTYLSHLGFRPIPTGDNKFVLCCPFHDDENPSFWIDDSYRNCNCFKPGCRTDKPMDILNLHMRFNDCSLSRAISELASFLGF